MKRKILQLNLCWEYLVKPWHVKVYWIFFILHIEYCFLSILDLPWEIHSSEGWKRKKMWVTWGVHEWSWLQLSIKSTKDLQERFIVGKKAKRTFGRELSYVQIPQTTSLLREVAGGPSYLFCVCPFHPLCFFYFSSIWRPSYKVAATLC